MASMADCYDVAVIGGGVVGCGVARACALAGRKTVLIEREAALAASHASGELPHIEMRKKLVKQHDSASVGSA